MVDRTCIRLVCKDGAYFEMDAPPDVNVGAFMMGAKQAGGVPHLNWFVPYESVLWAGRVDYKAVPEGEPTPPPISRRMQ